MAINKTTRAKNGTSVIEILVVVAIVVTVLTSLLSLASFSLKILSSLRKTAQANVLGQETIEAVRNFRDTTDWYSNGLGVVTVGIDYYPQEAVSPSRWLLSNGAEVIDGFSRRVVFADVMRDVNDEIIEDEGINDPDTKKVTVVVSWEGKEIEMVTYFTNWR